MAQCIFALDRSTAGARAPDLRSSPDEPIGNAMAERTEHRWVVDGIEEGMARVEEDGERMITLPVYLLPAGAAEGQVLRVTRGAEQKESVSVLISLDAQATERAMTQSKATMARTMAASRKRDPGGDVAL
ncbi:MAG TPA: DUF3006 domain-containing protein [Gemmatimonadaceae bacterium]